MRSSALSTSPPSSRSPDTEPVCARPRAGVNPPAMRSRRCAARPRGRLAGARASRRRPRLAGSRRDRGLDLGERAQEPQPDELLLALRPAPGRSSAFASGVLHLSRRQAARPGRRPRARSRARRAGSAGRRDRRSRPSSPHRAGAPRGRARRRRSSTVTEPGPAEVVDPRAPGRLEPQREPVRRREGRDLEGDHVAQLGVAHSCIQSGRARAAAA